MKIIRIIGRGIKDAGKSVFRNFSLSLASISSTAITLIIVSLLQKIMANFKTAMLF